jgi:hypothetical protein
VESTLAPHGSRLAGAVRCGRHGAVADVRRPGRPVRADARDRAALKKAVETSPRSLGFAFDVWTLVRLSQYSEDTTGFILLRAGCEYSLGSSTS